MILVKTSNPQELLDAIDHAIAADEITTWRKTTSGSFTHTPDQWKNKAWFRATVKTDERQIVFNIIRPKGGHVSSEAYAIYHGHFASMLLQHFDKQLKSIELSALASQGDNV